MHHDADLNLDLDWPVTTTTEQNLIGSNIFLKRNKIILLIKMTFDNDQSVKLMSTKQYFLNVCIYLFFSGYVSFKGKGNK